MKPDIEIAREHKMLPIAEIAKKLNIPLDCVETYGKYKAKIDTSFLQDVNNHGKLILVTAINPTPAGEGKTTTSIGLADAMNKLGKTTVAALREPSLGPVFGVKGGATGGGYSQVVPMEDINLHFTGDFHAIGAANNLLCAMLDNHIYQGNILNIDPRRIAIRRCVDMNDRQLRKIVDGLGARTNGMPREDGFDITVASEVMAVFCLATSIEDLQKKLGNIVVAYTYNGQAVTVKDLKAEGAMTALLKDAFKPNLVQTLEGTPVIIHGGPFANIAHGCNSIVATNTALKLADYCVTEAGFGADLGAEKFLDIKCRIAGLNPSAVVIVATVRALKYHGGAKKDQLEVENLDAIEKGLPNLMRHIDNMLKIYHLPVVVAINKFSTDTDEEIKLISRKCKEKGVSVKLSTAWANGGNGGIELAEEVIKLCEENAKFRFAYDLNDSVEDKILSIVKNIYGGKAVTYSGSAKKYIEELEQSGYGRLPICMAKTQYSFSDNPSLLGAPEGFTVNVKEIKLTGGAGFIIALTGDVMTMPGLPKTPAAENIGVNEKGEIFGLF